MLADSPHRLLLHAPLRAIFNDNKVPNPEVVVLKRFPVAKGNGEMMENVRVRVLLQAQAHSTARVAICVMPKQLHGTVISRRMSHGQGRFVVSSSTNSRSLFQKR